MKGNGHKHDIRSSRTRSYPRPIDKVRDGRGRERDQTMTLTPFDLTPSQRDNTRLAFGNKVRACSLHAVCHMSGACSVRNHTGQISPDLDRLPIRSPCTRRWLARTPHRSTRRVRKDIWTDRREDIDRNRCRASFRKTGISEPASFPRNESVKASGNAGLQHDA